MNILANLPAIKLLFLKRFSSLFLSISSGLLLVLSWPDSSFTAFIFIAWVPLLFIAFTEYKTVRLFWFSLLAMLVWNAGTTWWIWNSTGPGAAGAIVANSLLMTIPLCCFHAVKKRCGSRIGLLSFIVFWLSFEFIHLNWQLSWPWLTLGNVFALKTNWIQWYEFTGVSGGSLWILLVNVAVFLFINERRNAVWQSVSIILVIGLPVLISYLVSASNVVTVVPKISTNAIIVQPNIDPYNEKFDASTTSSQIEKLISLSEKNIDSNTRFVLWPETALPVPVWQNEVQQNVHYKPVFDFVNRHPNMILETGIETYKSYGATKATQTARKNATDNTYYDAFNAAIAIKAGEQLQFYNKSKLVPGVETLPDFLLWMSAVFEKFGGTTGGYGHDKEAVVFRMNNNAYITAPIICYESIYGEYITSYVRKGANVLTIITNDGWWANTPGHRQHLQYARLRAIETRKWVARSANTGISAVINPTGELVETRSWDTASFIKFALPTVSEQTFYVRHGDFIFLFAAYLAALVTGYFFFLLIKNRLNRKEA